MNIVGLLKRKSKENPYRDYYVWADPASDGGAPNRLKSAFSGSAWTFDEASGQYYLHLFSKTTRFKLGKPTNASVGLRDDEFWIDKGIGGFRLDVIDLVGKIPEKRSPRMGLIYIVIYKK